MARYPAIVVCMRCSLHVVGVLEGGNHVASAELPCFADRLR